MISYNNWYHAMRRAQRAATGELRGEGVPEMQLRILQNRVRDAFVEVFAEHADRYALHMETRAEEMKNP